MQKKIVVCFQHGLRLLPHPALHRQHQDHRPHHVPRVRGADREVEGRSVGLQLKREGRKHDGVKEIIYIFYFIRATLITYTILQRSRPQIL